MIRMTTQRQERIPELTLGWRLRLALGEMTRDEIAATMDVTPGTISRWCADKGAPPKRPYIVQWALATGVPVEWLEHGIEPDTGGPDGGNVVTARNSQTLRLAS